MTTPHITPVQVGGLSLLIRSSGIYFLQDPSFHETHCKGAYQSWLGLWGLTTSHITPVNQLSTVVRLSVRHLQHMCKVTVQSHKFWRHSWWLGFVCLFVCFYLFVCLFLLLCLLLFCFCFYINFFFSRILGMGGWEGWGVEALIRKTLGFLGGAGRYNLCWRE